MSRDPRSYRFQIRAHTRHDDEFGNIRMEYGVVLWSESDEAIEKVPLCWRVSTLTAKADEFAEKRGGSVAAGIVDVAKPDLFQPEYFATPPRIQVFELREHIGTGRLGDSRFIYNGTPGAR